LKTRQILRTFVLKLEDSCWAFLKELAKVRFGWLVVVVREKLNRFLVWSEKSVSRSFSFGEIPADLEHVTPYLEAAMSRVPRSQTAGMKHLFCGPESFTPDLGPLIGEVPEVGLFPRLFVSFLNEVSLRLTDILLLRV
jgi:glycine/D-amino acid oxidase-like deaminating enzyme